MVARSFLSALLLLAAIPVIAQTTTQWTWESDPKTGCKVFIEELDKDFWESISWSGTCVKSVAEGYGVLQWYDAGKPTSRFEGEMRGGKATGRGAIAFESGERYEGEWRDGKREGQGVYTSHSGDRYEGEWRDDKQSGRGVRTYEIDGKIVRYDGEWREGKQNGRGIQTRGDDYRYDGEWRDDEKNGRGVFTWFASGSSYDGEWRDGKPDGIGTKTTSDGRIYSGTWTKGCLRHEDRWVSFNVPGWSCDELNRRRKKASK